MKQPTNESKTTSMRPPSPYVDAPIGTIMMYGGKDPISLAQYGWRVCDGTLLSKQEFPELERALDGAYGRDGEDFYLPDCRGMFVRGVDEGRKKDPDSASRTEQKSGTGGHSGDKVGSVQEQEVMQHKHYAAAAHEHRMGAGKKIKILMPSYSGTQHNTKDHGGKETRPVNLYLYFIIKAEQSK
ncbi:MAG: phage tail protein [Bacteroidota bacterium]